MSASSSGGGGSHRMGAGGGNSARRSPPPLSSPDVLGMDSGFTPRGQQAPGQHGVQRNASVSTQGGADRSHSRSRSTTPAPYELPEPTTPVQAARRMRQEAMSSATPTPSNLGVARIDDDVFMAPETTPAPPPPSTRGQSEDSFLAERAADDATLHARYGELDDEAATFADLLSTSVRVFKHIEEAADAGYWISEENRSIISCAAALMLSNIDPIVQ